MKLKTVVFYLGFILVAIALTPVHRKSQIDPLSSNLQHAGPDADGMRIVESYGKLPLNFEANQGQTDPKVKFLSRGSGYTLFLAPTEAVLALRPARVSNPRQKSDRVHAAVEPEAAQAQAPAVLRMKLLGSNPAPRLLGLDPLSGKSNYFIGNDPKKWRTNVPSYSRVRYENVYAGVDLIYYGSQGQLEYDFVVAPGAAPDAITLGFEGAEGMAIDPQGNLVLSIGSGEISLHKPVVYQEVDGVRREIQGGYVLTERNDIRFEVPAYDATKPLVIDPTLAYSTYLGGSGFDGASFSLLTGIAVDSGGNAYVTGGTASSNFPTTVGSLQTASGGDFDAFVTKLGPTGSTLVYSTYLGGSGTDVGTAIAVETSGNAYITGQTNGGFPTTTGAFQTTFGGVNDAFVTKLNPAGSALVYSTYLGGSGSDSARAIAVDSGGNAYVTGSTNSTNFPTTVGAFQTVCGGCLDAFVTKFNAVGSALGYSTYLSGSNGASGSGIAVDSAGNAYVTGSTNSTNFPTTIGAFQTVFGGGSNDAFVTKFNATGSGLAYSTYLGGSGQDAPFPSGAVRIAVDSVGNAYVAGGTNSTNFPTTVGAFQTTVAGGSSFDAFVTKFNAAGSALAYSTYLGGSDGFDGANSIAADSSGNAYITGLTFSADFPTASPIQATPGSFQDAFVAKFNPTGSALVYSTFLGGSGSGNDEFGSGIAVDTAGNAYVTGMTDSTDFPTTTGAFQTTFGGGGEDVFVAKIASTVGNADVAVTKTGNPTSVNTGQNVTFTITVTNNGPDLAAATLNDVLPGSFNFDSLASPGGWTCTTPAVGATGTVNCTNAGLASGASDVFTLVITATSGGSIGNTATVSTPASDPVPGNNSATATTTVNASADLTVTKTASANPKVGSNLTYTITITNNGPSTATNVSATDTLPANITFVSGTITQGTCNAPAGGSVTCAIGTMAPGVSVIATVVVTPTATGSITNSISVTATEPDPNTANNSASVTVTVNPAQAPDFTLSPSPTTMTINQGQSASYTIAIAPVGGFNQTINMSCTTDAELATCSMLPTSVTLDGTNSKTSTATVGTTLGSVVFRPAPPARPDPFGPLAALRLLLASATAALILAMARGMRRRRWAYAANFTVLAVLFGMLCAGCGNGGGSTGSTPKGTHSVTINATSGATSHTVQVALIVQ